MADPTRPAASAPAGGARFVEDPSTCAKPDGWTRFVCFSDTHGKHDQMPQEHHLEADVLLHAGDFTNTGELTQVQSFSEWLRGYPATHKVVIAGNHDITFQPEFYEREWNRFHRQPYDCEEVRSALTGCHYLEDEMVQVAGYNVYGSPWQPAFCDWAFNLDPEGCRRAWEMIPPTEALPCPDVLIAHGPPSGILDKTFTGVRAGCPELKRAIRQRGVPVFLAGHIHEGYGAESDGVTLFLNASTCNLRYRPVQPPLVFDVPPPEELRRATAAAAAEARELAAGAGKRPSKTAVAGRWPPPRSRSASPPPLPGRGGP